MQTWRFALDPELVAEGFTRVTWEIDGGRRRRHRTLTVTHELEGAPMTAAQVAASHRSRRAAAAGRWILSDLKTLLETGSSFEG